MMDTYALTPDQFDSLASGYGSADTVGLLVDSQLARRRLLILAAAERAVERPEPAAATVRAAIELICRVEEHDPEAGRVVFRHPFVEAWFASLDGTGPWPDDAGTYLAGLAAATAASYRLPFTIRVRTAARALVLPTLGTASGVGAGEVELAGTTATLTVTGPDGRVTVQHPYDVETQRWRPLRRLHLSAYQVTVDDADPHRDRYGSHQPAPRLTGPLVDRWRAAGRDAGQLLAREQPEHWASLTALLHTIVPLAHAGGGSQSSATARDAFGAIALSTPPSGELLGELLVHELQHAKIDALFDLVDLCDTGDPPRLHAPWRRDARDTVALLDGLYAFAGVAGYWRGRSSADPAARPAQFRFAYWRQQCRYAVDQLLDAGRLTELGRRFCRTLAATLDGWLAEPVPAGAAAAAHLSAIANHVAWRLAHHRPAPAEVDTVVRAWRAHEPAPPLGNPAVVDAAAEVEPRLAGLARRAWETGRDEGERALPASDVALDGDEAWIGLCTTLSTGNVGVAYRRPDLLRAVVGRLGGAVDAEQLSRWLDAG